MRRSRVFPIVCLAALLALTACSQQPGQVADVASDPDPSVVRELTPREGVHYFEEGVHAAAETSVGVGVLRYRSSTTTEGTWVLVSRESPAVLAGEASPFVTLMGDAGFDEDFWPLDGQYVAVEGPVVGVDGRVTQMDVDGLSLVSDIFPADSNEYTTPGLYDRPDGSKLALGWIGEASDTLTTLYDGPQDASDSSARRPIARVMHDRQEHTEYLEFMQADVFVVEEGDPPLVQAIDGRVGYLSGMGRMTVGMPVAWRGVERTGVKDLPGGKTRVVGVVVRNDGFTGRPIPAAIGITEPWYPGILSYRMLITLAGPAVPDPNVEGYVAAEGTLKKTGEGYVLEAEELQQMEVPPWRGW